MSARVVVLLGTRPEAIKLAPIVWESQRFRDWDVELWSSGQHVELLAPVMANLGIAPCRELDVMEAGQGLSRLMAALVDRIDRALADSPPDWLVVQGDTATALAGTLAAVHRGIPVAHVEAGLRTGDLEAPFPEEAYRVLIDRLASLHFAPTDSARANLEREGIADATVTGNTVIDAIRRMLAVLPADGSPPDPSLLRFHGPRRLVLVTGHRRESFGEGIEGVCHGLATLAERYPSVDLVYPVHLNPNVQRAVRSVLGGRSNLHLLPPVDYAGLVWLLRRSAFVITDSGGLQEEAPELGKPVLVTRAVTERTESVAAGCAELIGYDPDRIVQRAGRLLDDADTLAALTPSHNPYGDGRAARRCVAKLRERMRLRLVEAL